MGLCAMQRGSCTTFTSLSPRNIPLDLPNNDLPIYTIGLKYKEIW